MRASVAAAATRARGGGTVKRQGYATAPTRGRCIAATVGSAGAGGQPAFVAHAAISGRRALLLPWVLSPLASSLLAFSAAHARPSVDPRLVKAFQDAMAAQGDFEAMEAAWSRAIDLDPRNSSAWSNRGTARLQFGHWQAAYEDLAHAHELEQQQGGQVSALLLNNLGNAEGALGRWQQAMVHYQAAAADPELESIARANYALAAFQVADQQLAIKEARQLLRRDPEFLDMRCALAAFLWANGDAAAAEGEWEALRHSQGDLGAALYSKATAVQRVSHRWPPRATAALQAFVSLTDHASVQGYDLQMERYDFQGVVQPAATQ